MCSDAKRLSISAQKQLRCDQSSMFCAANLNLKNVKLMMVGDFLTASGSWNYIVNNIICPWEVQGEANLASYEL